MNKTTLYPYIALAVGVAAVSTSAIFVKLTSAPAPVIAFYRLFFSTLLVLPLFLAKCLPQLKTMSRKDWSYSALAGVLLAFHFILWFESLNYTSVASSVVLVTLQPLFAFIGTYFFFKERVSIRAVISALLAIAGSAVISWGISGSAASLCSEIFLLWQPVRWSRHTFFLARE